MAEEDGPPAVNEEQVIRARCDYGLQVLDKLRMNTRGSESGHFRTNATVEVADDRRTILAMQEVLESCVQAINTRLPDAIQISKITTTRNHSGRRLPKLTLEVTSKGSLQHRLDVAQPAIMATLQRLNAEHVYGTPNIPSRYFIPEDKCRDLAISDLTFALFKVLAAGEFEISGGDMKIPLSKLKTLSFCEITPENVRKALILLDDIKESFNAGRLFNTSRPPELSDDQVIVQPLQRDLQKRSICNTLSNIDRLKSTTDDLGVRQNGFETAFSQRIAETYRNCPSPASSGRGRT